MTVHYLNADDEQPKTLAEAEAVTHAAWVDCLVTARLCDDAKAAAQAAAEAYADALAVWADAAEVCADMRNAGAS